MAAVQNLEVIVDIDISKALAKLTELQDELREVANAIDAVDARGAEGIDIRTSVDQADAELAALAAEIKAFEATNAINIDTDVDRLGPHAPLTRPHRLAGMRAQQAGNMGELFDFLGLPGGRRRRGAGGRIFRKLSDQVGELGEELRDFKLRMSTLHNLLASFIPLLVVFIGAIPTVINALLALATAAIAAAGAFAVIAGLGAMGAATRGGQMPSMEDFQEFGEDIRDSFFEAFAPLAERFEGTFMDALDGLERFFQAIANQGDALVALEDEARAFGRFMTRFIPDVLRALAGAVEALEPVFAGLGEFLHEDTEIIRTMTRLTLEALPSLANLANTLASALPGIVEFSTGMLHVTTATIEVISAMVGLLNILGISNEALGTVIGSFLALTTLMSLTAFVASSKLGAALAGLVKLIFTRLLLALSGGAAGMMAMSASTFLATAALAAFLTVASLGLLVGLSALAFKAASDFLGLADGINAATDAMQNFDRVATGTSNFNPYGAGATREASRIQNPSGGSNVTINMESRGDKEKDNSDASVAAWRGGRTTGGRP